MAIGTKSDFIIYHEEFFGGLVEVLQQNADAFNQASNNAIRLVPMAHRGDYEKESFFKEITALVSRRDPTSTAAATDAAFVQGEQVSVKLSRKIGPVANTLDSFRKIATDPSEFSFLLGQQYGQAVALDYLSSALTALVAAITNQSALNYDATGDTPATLTHTALVNGFSTFGDAHDRIVCLVMHSKPYFDLIKQSIADKVFEVAGATIYSGTPATFGKPVIVTDDPALKTPGSPNTYSVLALVEGAADVYESEEREIASELVTGKENLVLRIQGEYAFTLRLKGYTWDVTNGGANPTS